MHTNDRRMDARRARGGGTEQVIEAVAVAPKSLSMICLNGIGFKIENARTVGAEWRGVTKKTRCFSSVSVQLAVKRRWEVFTQPLLITAKAGL